MHIEFPRHDLVIVILLIFDLVGLLNHQTLVPLINIVKKFRENHHIFRAPIRINAQFHQAIILPLQSLKNPLIQRSKQFTTNHKNQIRINLTPKNPLFNFRSLDIFEPKDVLSIMVGNKSAIHSANFLLKSIFQKRPPHLIIVLSLIAGMDAADSV